MWIFCFICNKSVGGVRRIIWLRYVECLRIEDICVLREDIDKGVIGRMVVMCVECDGRSLFIWGWLFRLDSKKGICVGFFRWVLLSKLFDLSWRDSFVWLGICVLIECVFVWWSSWSRMILKFMSNIFG